MEKNLIPKLRHVSRKLIRELGMLQLNKEHLTKTPQHWHALIEISKDSNLTISKLGHLLLLSTSAMSRIVGALIKDGFVIFREGDDKREKFLNLTAKGKTEIEIIDDFSNARIKGALAYLKKEEQREIIAALQKYGEALEKSRVFREEIKILKLSTSRVIRKQIHHMIETIQKKEFSIPITNEINACILRAEEDFYYENSYNFWYAVDKYGCVIGSIGLKRIDNKTAEIKKFFVEPLYRGKGIAQKLMNSLLQSAVRHHFQELYLGTTDVLKGAQRFYEKYSFLLITRQQLPLKFNICPLDTIFFKGLVIEVRQKLMKGLE